MCHLHEGRVGLAFVHSILKIADRFQDSRPDGIAFSLTNRLFRPGVVESRIDKSFLLLASLPLCVNAIRKSLNVPAMRKPGLFTLTRQVRLSNSRRQHLSTTIGERRREALGPAIHLRHKYLFDFV